MVGSEAAPAATLAERALAIATSHPLEAQAMVQPILADPAAYASYDRVLAQRVLGLSARTLMQVDESLEHFGRAIQLAQDSHLDDEVARTRVSRAAALGLSGRPDEALADIEASINQLSGTEKAQALAQKAAILGLMGRFDQALEVMRVIIRAFRESGDTLWEARARANRSYIHLLTGAVDAGEREAKSARALYQRAGHVTGVVYTDHHLAILAGLRGDIPTALAGFEAVARSYRELGIPPEQGADAHVAILLAARLARDARDVAEAAVAELRETGNEAAVPELLLAVARADLMLADHARAREAAEEAATWFTKQGLDAWAATADLLAVTARFARGERTAALQALAEATAGALAGRAWLAASLDAQLLAGRVALSRGQGVRALELLRTAAAPRRGQALASRISGCHARALVEVLEGNAASAQRVLSVGLDLVDQYREALGATEMRVRASEHAQDLATLGLELAFANGRAVDIFAWSERRRAATIMLRPVRPPKDQRLARTLARLRSVSNRLEHEPAVGPVVSGLRRQERELEHEVRQLTYGARGAGDRSGRRLTASSLRPYLTGSALVQLVVSDDELHAVVVRRSGTTHRRLAPLSEIRKELSAIRFDLAYLARRSDGPATATIASNLEHGVARLDELIFHPIRPLLAVERLILSPPGELLLLPWSMLATCRARLLTVAPSAALWLRAATLPPPTRSRSVAAAGPDLSYAEVEVEAIARMGVGRRSLVGAEATTAAVARAVQGASLAHLACHGHFRNDNPSFSSLQFSDGPLYVYDLERLRRPPHVIVLSACDAGRAAISAGEEIRGLIAALLALGTQAVIASVLPVRDDASHHLMIDLHRHLSAGASPAWALAEAQRAAWGSKDAVAMAAAGAFGCFGAGWPVEALPAKC